MTDAAFARLSYPALATGSAEELERARTRGHAAGYAAGLRKAESEFALREAARQTQFDEQTAAARLAALAALRALDAAAGRVAELRVPVLAEADAALAAAAIELAEAIIRKELDLAETAAKAAVSRALAAAVDDEILAVRMNPCDLAIVEAGVAPGIRFVADAAIAPGDAIVDIPTGMIDARISSSLERARRLLSGGSL